MNRTIENKILDNFRRKLGDSAKHLNLLISIPDTFEEELECEIMEAQDNGKVWNVTCTKNGNIKFVNEL